MTVWTYANTYEYGHSIHVFATKEKALKHACSVIKETLSLVSDDKDLVKLESLLETNYEKAIQYWNGLDVNDYFDIEEKEVQ